MEDDLRRRLHDLSAAPSLPPEAVATGVVRARVRRGRALRLATAGTMAAALVVVAAAVVQAAPWEPDAGLPAQPPTSTTQEPAPTTPEPTGAPDPTATEGPTATEDGPGTVLPLVAVTEAGAVVELDPLSGVVVREVSPADPSFEGPVSLTPDRSAAYVQTAPRPGEQLGAIVRVGLDDGVLQRIDTGRAPSVSPDGSRLAYVTLDQDASVEGALALVVMNLRTWERIRIALDPCDGCAQRIDRPAWSPDGGTLYVAVGTQGAPVPATELRIVDLTTLMPLSRAPVFRPADRYVHGTPLFPTVLADGTLAVVSVTDDGTGDASDGWDAYHANIETFDPATAGTLSQVQLPELGAFGPEGEVLATALDLAAGPDGTLLAVAQAAGGRPTLLVWDGRTLRMLAEGIVGAAW